MSHTASDSRSCPRTSMLALILLLSACGGGLTGTYSVGGLAATSYEFRSDGTVVYDGHGSRITAKYELDGERIIIKFPQGGEEVLTREGDDSIKLGQQVFKKEAD